MADRQGLKLARSLLQSSLRRTAVMVDAGKFLIFTVHEVAIAAELAITAGAGEESDPDTLADRPTLASFSNIGTSFKTKQQRTNQRVAIRCLELRFLPDEDSR